MAALFFDHDSAHKRLDRATDHELLRYVGRAGLVIVTHNEHDFVALHDNATFIHAGIVAIPHVRAQQVQPLIQAIDALLRSGQAIVGQCYPLRVAGWQRRADNHRWADYAAR